MTSNPRRILTVVLSLNLGLLVSVAQTTTDSSATPAALVAGPLTPSQTQLVQTQTLMDAAEQGDMSSRTQLNQLVTAVQQDPTVPEHDRFALASRLIGLSIAQNHTLDRSAKLAAYEQAARQMAAMFPAQVEPYYSLMALAEDQPDSNLGAKIAADLLTMPAPPEIKSRAQDLLDREAMVGLPLDYSFRDSFGNTLTPSQFRGRVVVIYAWTGRAQGSAAWINRLLKEGNGLPAFIGLNFDTDRENSDTLVHMYAKSSEQVFDPTGLTGDTARRLHLTRVPSVYLIDQAGVLQDVRALQNFSPKLAALLAKGTQP